MTMDSSEWELMKDKEKLLEAALEREQKLSDKIILLQEAETRRLESNDKVVTIINVKRTREIKKALFSPRELQSRLKGLFDYRYRAGIDSYSSSSSSDTWRIEEVGFFDELFKSETHEFETDRTVTKKGLDEYVSEIKKQYYLELETSTKQDLESFRELKIEADSWKEDSTKLQKSLNFERKSYKTLQKHNDKGDKLLLEQQRVNTEQQKLLVDAKRWMIQLAIGVENMPSSFLVSTFRHKIIKFIRSKEKEIFKEERKISKQTTLDL